MEFRCGDCEKVRSEKDMMFECDECRDFTCRECHTFTVKGVMCKRCNEQLKKVEKKTVKFLVEKR